MASKRHNSTWKHGKCTWLTNFVTKRLFYYIMPLLRCKYVGECPAKSGLWGYNFITIKIARCTKQHGPCIKVPNHFFSLSILLIAQLRYQILIFLEMKFKITLVVIAVFKNWKMKNWSGTRTDKMEPELVFNSVWGSVCSETGTDRCSDQETQVSKPRWVRETEMGTRNGRSKCLS